MDKGKWNLQLIRSQKKYVRNRICTTGKRGFSPDCMDMIPVFKRFILSFIYVSKKITSPH